VLDDVVLHCKRGQAGIDADVAALREASQRARLLYLMRVTQGQVGRVGCAASWVQTAWIGLGYHLMLHVRRAWYVMLAVAQA
jgi:hypothetical protein